jgi:hypothetical protein
MRVSVRVKGWDVAADFELFARAFVDVWGESGVNGHATDMLTVWRPNQVAMDSHFQSPRILSAFPGYAYQAIFYSRPFPKVFFYLLPNLAVVLD